MTDPTVCPNCGQSWTDRVDTQIYGDSVHLIYVCSDCGAEYNVEFGDPIKEEVDYL